jgi:hypothetical protein
MVWRMSPYERREGVTPLQAALETAPARVTPVPGKGALGTRWPGEQVLNHTLSWVLRGLRRGEGAMQTPLRRGEGCTSTAQFRPVGGRPALRNGVQSRGQNRTREIRPPGGNVATWEPGVRPGAKATEHPPDPVMVRALNLYPDNRTHGLERGIWKRARVSERRASDYE